MKTRALPLILGSLLISLAVYLALTWPLGRHFQDGIPSSNRPEAGGARYMIPGDHLQFLYQLWTLADACTGQTPLFYNVYEFNQGNDQDSYTPGSYYFPFGLLYAAGYGLGGRVLGWNLMLVVTVWLVFLSTWLLLRRFTDSWLTAGVGALPAILLPYFHVSLLGGSPTGLGMLWVPLIFLGLDQAIRDRKVWGGVLAGTLLFIASWVDLHVFFFVFLATPVWVLMCLVIGRAHRTLPPLKSLGWPLLPVLLGMVGAYLQTSIIKASLDHTLQSEGRSLKESLGYALQWTGWLDGKVDNPSTIIYLGAWVAGIIVVGLGYMLYDTWRRRAGAPVRLGLLLLVVLAILGIAVLALGPNTPFDHEHRFWKFLRAVIPPYKMIRQPAKVYCLLTPFIGLALVMVLDQFNRSLRHRSAVVLLAAVVAAGCLVDYGRRLDPTICLLDSRQGAYQAVAADAAACGRENRALAIPLWPGDSHWNSITEYYSTLYRTKMLNGYSPSVSRQYFTNVFQRFEAINMGAVTDDTLDGLLAMKIGYLLLHEDAFPPKVSPFPASQTARALRCHPRLQFLAQDKAVLAFKIMASTGSAVAAPLAGGQPPPVPILSAWQWDACDVAKGAAYVAREGAQAFMRLPEAGGVIQLDARDMYPLDGLRYVVAVRGQGRLAGTCGTGLADDAFAVAVTNGDRWAWAEIPVPVLPAGRQTWLALAFSNTTGQVDVGMLALLAGPWSWLKPGETLVVPADSFCGNGYFDASQGGLQLDRMRTQASVAFSGPVIPVLPGRYQVSLDYATAGQPGAALGEFSVLRSDGQARVTVPVEAGRSVVVDYDLPVPRPLKVEFRFSRAADMIIHSITLRRLE